MALPRFFDRRNTLQKILVIRFGALGDLCVLGWTLSACRAATEQNNLEITLVTKKAWAPLAETFTGVDRVIALEGSGFSDLVRLAGQLRGEPWDQIIDAHNILRGHLLLMLMGRRPNARLAKDTAARLSLLKTGRTAPSLSRTTGQRFDALLDTVDLSRNPEAVPPLLHLRGAIGSELPVVGLAPGAQWDTKRWPDTHFAEFVRLYRDQSSAPIRIYLGPREKPWYAESPLSTVAAASDAVEVVADQSLPEVARNLAQCDLLITNDSGLLHVAEAVGTPVLAFFGPTVEAFGYFPQLPSSRVLERDVFCRPCSRNGKRPCHTRDLACLQPLTPESALSAVLDMLAKGIS